MINLVIAGLDFAIAVSCVASLRRAMSMSQGWWCALSLSVGSCAMFGVANALIGGHILGWW